MYKTLEELTCALKELGFSHVRCSRSYKRKGHRDVLIHGFLIFKQDFPISQRKEHAHKLLSPLLQDFHIPADQMKKCVYIEKGLIELDLLPAKVQLPEEM